MTTTQLDELQVTNPVPTATVAVINESSACTDEEIASYVPALQTQVTRDFAPRWGADAKLVVVPRGSRPPSGSWWLVVLDTSDQAGALGYHDLTSDGYPISKVFAKSDKDSGSSVSVTMSHELLEMLGDPGINRGAFVDDGHGGLTLYAYEACDACEDDSLGYQIGEVLVSDFVLPSWFGGTADTQFDFRNQLTAAGEISPLGYTLVWTATTGWTQRTGSAAHGIAHRSRPGVGSRRERRRVPRADWARSDVLPLSARQA